MKKTVIYLISFIIDGIVLFLHITPLLIILGLVMSISFLISLFLYYLATNPTSMTYQLLVGKGKMITKLPNLKILKNIIIFLTINLIIYGGAFSINYFISGKTDNTPPSIASVL